eukprot:gb/GFBE01029976.1/.p1 GENE.gb/GFBE01029976.1/~~gb/GFBE01029976.1/.p1  ORF type:complete len:301 (+),score=36.83 gb/GFBE01029976.1/:1-903(+)
MGDQATCADSVVLTIVDDAGSEEEQTPPAPATQEVAGGSSSSVSRPGLAEPAEEQDTEILEWQVALSKDGQELGIDVLQHEKDNLRVTKIKAGLIQMWNRQNRDQAVRPGDRIYAVNGETGNADWIISAIRSSSNEVVLGVRRLLWLRLEIVREPAGTLGIDVASHSRHLQVLKIRSGPLLDYNNEADCDRQVRANDHIVEVNGVRGTAEDLLKAIRTAGTRLNFLLRVSCRFEQPRICLPDSPRSDRDSGADSPRPLGAGGVRAPLPPPIPSAPRPPVEEAIDERNEPPGGHYTVLIQS